MTQAMVSIDNPDLSALWRDYWATWWHHDIDWPQHRLNCFLTADAARRHARTTGGDGLVSDKPLGRRPFLGALTNAPYLGASALSGALEYNETGHLLTVAPTRAGKGTSQIITNLLLYAGSSLIIDIKGENYGITADYRRRFFDGAKVLKFAPFDDDTHRYNPLDFIRVDEGGVPNSNTYDDTRLLSEMLIPSRSNDDFWDTEARGLLTMILFYVATRDLDPAYRSMRSVIRLLFPTSVPETDPEKPAESPIDRTIRKIKIEAERSENITLEALVTQFIEHDTKVRAGILSTCRAAMSIWLSDRLLRATDESDFEFADLKRSMCRPIEDNPAPTSLYVVIPPEYLREYRSVLRMIVGLAAIGLTRHNAWDNSVDAQAGWLASPPCPVLFLLDEFPQLGYMSPIEQGVAYLAGYGVQLWTFVQSIGQLKEIYKDNWTTFISNAGATCYFGIADPDLCNDLSKQLGKAGEYEIAYTTTSRQEGTSWSDTSGSSDGSSSSRGWEWNSGSSGSNQSSSSSTTDGGSESLTVSGNKRWKEDNVAEPSDIRAMPPSLQLIMLRNKRPVLASLVPFHRCDLFLGRYTEWKP